MHLQFTRRLRFIDTETTLQPLSTVPWDDSFLQNAIFSFTVAFGVQLIFTCSTVRQVTVDISCLYWIRSVGVAIILKYKFWTRISTPHLVKNLRQSNYNPAWYRSLGLEGDNSHWRTIQVRATDCQSKSRNCTVASVRSLWKSSPQIPQQSS